MIKVDAHGRTRNAFTQRIVNHTARLEAPGFIPGYIEPPGPVFTLATLLTIRKWNECKPNESGDSFNVWLHPKTENRNVDRLSRVGPHPFDGKASTSQGSLTCHPRMFLAGIQYRNLNRCMMDAK